MSIPCPLVNAMPGRRIEKDYAGTVLRPILGVFGSQNSTHNPIPTDLHEGTQLAVASSRSKKILKVAAAASIAGTARFGKARIGCGGQTTCAKPTHLCGGFADYLHLLPDILVTTVGVDLPTQAAVLMGGDGQWFSMGRALYGA
jgi:hypothetical protein